LSGAQNIVEAAYSLVDFRREADLHRSRKNADGTAMSRAQHRRHKEKMTRRAKRMRDQIFRTVDEFTGLPLGRAQRVIERENERRLRQ
jgi:hypothetical protein